MWTLALSACAGLNELPPQHLERNSPLPADFAAWLLGTECLASHPGAADRPGGNMVPVVADRGGWRIHLTRQQDEDFRAARDGWLQGPSGWQPGRAAAVPSYLPADQALAAPWDGMHTITVEVAPIPSGGCTIDVATRGRVGAGLTDRMRSVLLQAERLQAGQLFAADGRWQAVRDAGWAVRTMIGSCSAPLDRWLQRTAWQLERDAARALSDVEGEERALVNLQPWMGTPTDGQPHRSRLASCGRRSGGAMNTPPEALRHGVDRLLDQGRFEIAELQLNRALRDGIQLPGDAVRLRKLAAGRDEPWLAAGWAWLAAVSAETKEARGMHQRQAHRQIAVAGEPRLARLLTWSGETWTTGLVHGETAVEDGEPTAEHPRAIMARYLLMLGRDEAAGRAIGMALEDGALPLHRALLLFDVQGAMRDRRLRAELAAHPDISTTRGWTTPKAWHTGYPGFDSAPGVAPLR